MYMLRFTLHAGNECCLRQGNLPRVKLPKLKVVRLTHRETKAKGKRFLIVTA